MQEEILDLWQETYPETVCECVCVCVVVGAPKLLALSVDERRV